MKKNNCKYGISLVSLAIVIIVMTILAGVIVTTSFNSVNTANIKMFAMEISNIKTNVDNYYLKHNVYPISNTIEYTVSSNTTDFENENIVDGVVSLKEINISQIGLKNLNFGNKNETNDVYAVSELTGKVYYLLGVRYNSKTYYTINEEIEKIAGISFLNKPEYNEFTEYDVIFKVSNTKPTNLPVTVIVKIPKSATVNSITASNSKIVSSETVEPNYKKYTVNETGENRNGNYVIEVNYTYNGATKTAKYSVTNFNNTSPVISYSESVSNGLRTVNVSVTGSNIIDLKYETKHIEDSSYFENYGKRIKNNSFIVNDDDVFTIYAKDSSGNYSNAFYFGNILLVTFDANGGTVSTSNKLVTNGSPYGELPTPTRAGYTFLGWSYTNFISEYQQVEYIESTGTQYIDVAFNPDQNTRTVIDFQFVSGYSSGRIFGVRNSYTSRAYFLSLSTATGGTPFANYGTQNVMGTVNDTNSRQLWDFNKNKFYVNETLLKTFNIESFTTAESAILFGAKDLSKTSKIGLTKAKVYSCKIYDNDILIRDFIPCYRKSDNEAGMYDKVNNVFYTNAGTGSFTVGGIVSGYIYITDSTVVNANSNHTLTAIWSENE